MTLDEAVERFESNFQTIVPPVDPDGKATLPNMWSGGECSHEQVAPALYSSPERAIQAWFDSARTHIPNNASKLEWVLKPELISYQITMADRMQRHRLVNDRHCVKSQFVIS